MRRPGFNATQTFGLIGLLWGQARRRARSWPFDSGKKAFCTIFCALSDAPLNVANGRGIQALYEPLKNLILLKIPAAKDTIYVTNCTIVYLGSQLRVEHFLRTLRTRVFDRK